MVKKAKKVNIVNYDSSKKIPVNKGVKKRHTLMVVYDSKTHVTTILNDEK